MADARLISVLAAAAAAGLIAAPAAGAGAGTILYRCFPNVCRVAPDGSGRTQVTSDGAPAGPAYGWLSATPDGARLGVSFGNDAFVLDGSGRRLAGPLPKGGAVLVTEIRPDGAEIATLELLPGVLPPPPGPAPGPVIPITTSYLFAEGADGAGRDVVARAVATTGWLGARLLRDDAASASPFAQQICVLASNTDFPCERLVAAEADHDLWDPAVSPDGTLVAATRAAVRATRGQIALYSAATGALVRVLSAGPDDSQPTWSPDGRSLAFTRGGGGLWVVPAAGAPGSERRILASGVQPVWVSGGGRTTPVLSGPARVRAGARVRLRLADAPRGARARLQRRAGRLWRTLVTRTTGAGTTTFTTRLAPGRAVLRISIAQPGKPALVSAPLTVRVAASR